MSFDAVNIENAFARLISRVSGLVQSCLCHARHKQDCLFYPN